MGAAEPEHLGLVRYVGTAVDAGYLDARRSAQALLGLDEALRFFVGAQRQALAKADYEIPVQVRQGSIVIVIPDIAAVIGLALAPAIGMYATTAAKKMAERDFDGIGLRDLLRRSIQAIQWAIRIGKHVGSLARRVFDSGVQWRSGNREVGIPNASGQLLWVPVEFLDMFERMPPSLLAKITSVVADQRRLEVVTFNDGDEESVEVDILEKAIFCPEELQILFPELEHGAPFDCEGLVTRGNENANSLGFQYEGHILTCYPEEGNISRFKPALFLRSRIHGLISRADKFGNPTELRPRIVFTSVEPLEDETHAQARQQALFLDEAD
jgi:hypothetical protein